MFTPLSPWHPIAGHRRRESSYDRSGGNGDFIIISAGERRSIFRHAGSPGRILRIWLTLNTDDPCYLQNVKVRLLFDSQITADDIPLGMLTATGPWRVNDLRSTTVNVMRARMMNTDQTDIGKGSFNLSWTMPFCDNATIEIFNDSSITLKHLFYHVDYLADEPLDPNIMPLHLMHHRQHPTRQVVATGSANDPDLATNTAQISEAKNCTDVSNYVIADIKGYTGTYVGTFLVVESHPDRPGKWYEGDDMFSIDDDTWPPSLHGTGTEDYFGMAWGIHRPYQADDHGVTHYERHLTDHDRFFDGRFGLYRWHISDPIPFRYRLLASIEAGHANECAQYYESLAIWYGRKNPQK